MHDANNVQIYNRMDMFIKLKKDEKKGRYTMIPSLELFIYFHLAMCQYFRNGSQYYPFSEQPRRVFRVPDNTAIRDTEMSLGNKSRVIIDHL